MTGFSIVVILINTFQFYKIDPAQAKRRGSRGGNLEDDFDELDEDDDEDGEFTSSLSRTTRGVSLTRKWGTATMLLLLFLVVEMLVLWVIVG